MNNNLPLLPVGQQNFAELRNKGHVYVDKTMYLYHLIFGNSVFLFLSRPRRFGKSLLISTLKAIFEGRKELFEGLYIHDKMTWDAHPVIHLDFSQIGFRDIGLRQALEKRMQDIANEYGIVLTNEGISLKFGELMASLHKKTGKQVAILIDEYDKPITDVLELGHHAKALEYRELLRSFYSVVKGSSAHIRFFFLTGISRFSKVSLFSDLNNLTDLTYSRDYHGICGYTQQELEQSFTPHLDFVAEEMETSREALLLQVKEWYNGYCWNTKAKARLYNPYSILRFLDAREFRNFWFDSGTPKFLVTLLKEQMVFNLSKTPISEAFINNFDIEHLNIQTLLFQTGYLTIERMDQVENYILSYPNKEVEQSMLQYLIGIFTDREESGTMAKYLAVAIKEHNMTRFIQMLDALFASIPYQIFDQHQEKYFHSIIFLSLKLCGFYVQAEVSTSAGRLDAVMAYQNRIYVFEFKLDGGADEAIAQIKEKGYQLPYLGQGKEIYLVGINFSSKLKAVDGWLLERVE